MKVLFHFLVGAALAIGCVVFAPIILIVCVLAMAGESLMAMAASRTERGE